MARELSSVPDLGAPTERLLPLRSASVLMPLSDVAQLVELGLEPCLLVALPGGLQRIAERKRNLAAALLQQDQIFDRGLGGLDLGLRARNLVAEDFSDGDAEWIIHAGCTAGQHVDEGLRLR
jgi:hypothetical protein